MAHDISTWPGNISFSLKSFKVSLWKPLFFGYILSSIGCFYGMRTSGGTQGVGRSTIQAVVTSSVLIIFVDFIITRLLINIFAAWI